MKTLIHNAIHQVDEILAPFLISTLKEQNAFNSFLFHALFEDKNEIAKNIVDPQQQVTVDVFRSFVEYFLEKGYEFVSPEQVLKGLAPEKKSILITFDDGYFNNTRALPILEEYKVPALFFISANHVLKGKAFWWDVVHREGKKRGFSDAEIKEEMKLLLLKTDDKIDEYLIQNYGEGILEPVSNTDRPFTPSELNEFAQHPYVYIGNHTCDHAVLTNYTEEGIREQIAKAQEILESIIGYKPNSLAYPCGEYNERTLQISEEEGIILGITTCHAKNSYTSLSNKRNLLTLNRFTIWGNKNLKVQCDFYRSDYHLLKSMRGVYHRLKALS